MNPSANRENRPAGSFRLALRRRAGQCPVSRVRLARERYHQPDECGDSWTMASAMNFRSSADVEPGTTYSTLQVARRLGVSVQTVQRWVDTGRLRAWKTPGGHRRIHADDALTLYREFALGGQLPEPGPLAEPPSLLVVDDNPVAREFTVAQVQIALPLATVSTASSGFEALLAAGRHNFDALITDIFMPHMNGFEMLRHLALDKPHRPRFMLAISSHSAEELRALGSLPPEVEFLPKPLDLHALTEWLERSTRVEPPARGS